MCLKALSIPRFSQAVNVIRRFFSRLRFRVDPIIASVLQHRIGQAFTFHSQRQRLQSVNGIDLAIALVQPEHEFVNVKLRMLP